MTYQIPRSKILSGLVALDAHRSALDPNRAPLFFDRNAFNNTGISGRTGPGGNSRASVAERYGYADLRFNCFFQKKSVRAGFRIRPSGAKPGVLDAVRTELTRNEVAVRVACTAIAVDYGGVLIWELGTRNETLDIRIDGMQGSVFSAIASGASMQSTLLDALEELRTVLTPYLDAAVRSVYP